MKIAVTASGLDLNSPLDPRFGRASFFIIYDTDQKSFLVANNEQNLNAPQGAGFSPRNVAKTGVSSVITGIGTEGILSASEAKITSTNRPLLQFRKPLINFSRGLKVADQGGCGRTWLILPLLPERRNWETTIFCSLDFLPATRSIAGC